MSTTTQSTLRDRLMAHLEQADGHPSPAVAFDDGISALVAGILSAWEPGDLEELRSSEVRWLDLLHQEARTAAKEAAVTAAVDVLEAGLRSLATGRPDVPAQLVDSGSDALREDLALVTGAA